MQRLQGSFLLSLNQQTRELDQTECIVRFPAAPELAEFFIYHLLVKAAPTLQALYADALKATKEHKRAVVGAVCLFAMRWKCVLAGQLTHPGFADVLPQSAELAATSRTQAV